MQGRYYAGKPIVVEFSPVTDFREATCRQYEENNCSRGGYCNFMHVRPVSRELRKQVRRPGPEIRGWAGQGRGGPLPWLRSLLCHPFPGACCVALRARAILSSA